MKKLIIGVLGILMSVSVANAATASWYKHGKRTANGERFNPYGLTAAHRTLPFNTRVQVTHKGKSVTVRINDRGPFIRGRDIDLSLGAAQKIGCTKVGVCKVKMKVIRKH